MVTTAVRELFVDTNVLIYATNSASPWHGNATTALQRAERLAIPINLSAQILREYLAAGTRPSVTGGSLPLPRLFGNIASFRSRFRVLEDTPAVFDALVNLVQAVPVAGKQIHDANIVATMQTHGVHHLLTNNVADFARFSPFITVVPI
ncbi:MAG: PIN domain-containing protein [Chloroflexota bacterium]|nr:PIN domain-containing protein [Chloroflexota bacterium]